MLAFAWKAVKNTFLTASIPFHSKLLWKGIFIPIGGKTGGMHLHRETQRPWQWAVSGALAGAVNGLFGAGGGMVLVPLLLGWVGVEEKAAFACSTAIILPLCLVSAGVYWLRGALDPLAALPYLLGGLAGGWLGGRLFRRIPAAPLRRVFALFLLYGGVRYLL